MPFVSEQQKCMANILIEIAYLTPENPWLKSLVITLGSTIHQALNQAQFFELFPALNPGNIEVGVFGIKKQLSDVLKPGDRIEIYRPLLCDPKQARRTRSSV